jgi:subtilase family serine protease
VPAAVAHLIPAGRLAATNQLNLAIGLPLRDSAGLDDFLARVTDPASPDFRHFLTPAEFIARFGPTEQDYESVKNFALTNGLTVTRAHGNRLLLDVRGSAVAVEKAFHVTLRTYRHPTEKRDFFAPDSEPTVDGLLPIADVCGLENFSLPHPMLHSSATVTGPNSGSAPNGYSYFGSDFRNAYVPGTTLDGTGQSVGLLQFEGYYPTDIVTYATLAGGGRTNITLQNVLVDGSTGVPNPSDVIGIAEVSLDIEMAMSMAPGLSRIVVFEDVTTTPIPNDVLNAMAASNSIKNLSSSWNWSGGPSATTDNIFKQMAAQGQSYFNASGDSDALPPGNAEAPKFVTTPASSPYITVVGGTTLTMTGAGGAYASEAVWNSGFVANNNKYEGTSGGVSTTYSIPTWQMGINSFLTNGGTPTKRNFPDVALTADNVYVLYNNTNAVFGGTSCATPLWAGFMALVNQQAAINSQPSVGFINPAVYELANESVSSAVFHDITTGNNTWPSSTNSFYAVPGYDLCTGLGTPAGTNLINALLNPDSLVVISNGGFSAASLAGAFPVTSQTFYLTNAGNVPLAWSLINTSLWLNVSASGGTLAPGAGSSVVVSLNTTASNLSVGTYSANLWFTNLTSGIAHARFFSLVVSESLVQNGGFETSDFTDWTLFGRGIIGNYIANAVESPFGPDHYQVAHSGQYGALLGDSLMAILAQTVPTVPGQKYLLSFWLNSPVGGAPISGHMEQFEVNWNTNAVTNTVYYVQNPPAFGWTNFNFVVTATGTNTTLQFGAENQPNFFGLDDISAIVIPSPSFAAVFMASNGVALTWNTLPNAGYLVQYKTNLLQANWLNLGGLITAVTNTLTLVDTNAFNASSQRFYRVSVSP